MAPVRCIFGRSVGAIALLLLMVASSAAWAKPVVTGIRIGIHPGATRVVLDLTEDARHTIFTLPDPYRVVIDLPEVEWRLDASAPAAARGLVQRYRYGLYLPGTSRVVIDLAAPALVLRTFVLKPMANFGYRLVLDLAPVTVEQYRRQAQPPPRETPPPPPEPAPRGPGKLIVVVDPGHGGVDPGTIGISGVHEKHIALQAALELRRQLAASGKYTVVMTRDRDVFVRLERRVAVARAAGANLFISLHADSIAKKHTRGATVYTLSEKASDQEAAALAAKENTADITAGTGLFAEAYDENVTKILIDLAQRKTMDVSIEFAGGLISELGKATRLRRETHRFAGFRVLKAPDVPSVLVELGYLSNRDDERILRDPNYRRDLMRAIVRAIDRFFAMQQAASSL